MPSRDLTPGELQVKLDSLLDLVQGISKNMVTKDVFDTWREGNNARVGRVESGLEEWKRTSTEAHVSLDKDSKARHQETTSVLAAEAVERRTEDEKIRKEVQEYKDRVDDIERSKSQNRTAILGAYGVAVLSIVIGVVLKALGLA